jgi:uncharacterized protein
MLQNTLDNLPACAGCGSCCHLVVELVTGVDDVPEAFVVEHSGVRCMDQRGNGACVALDSSTRLCTIYERRPKACRDFNRGEALCLKALARFALAAPQPPSSTP